MKKPEFKSFKVAAVSSNRNSFGLTGLVLVAQDGEAWQVGVSQHHIKAQGDVVRVPVVSKQGRNFAVLGFEIPERLPRPPAEAVAEVWGTKR